jgi:hypothetical protein
LDLSLTILNKYRVQDWPENIIFAHKNFTISSDGCREWPAFTWVGLEHSNPDDPIGSPWLVGTT